MELKIKNIMVILKAVDQNYMLNSPMVMILTVYVQNIQHIGWHTFGTAAWKTKSVNALEDKFVKVAWIFVVCGLPGCFERLNVNLKELLSNAVIDG